MAYSEFLREQNEIGQSLKQRFVAMLGDDIDLADQFESQAPAAVCAAVDGLSEFVATLRWMVREGISESQVAIEAFSAIEASFLGLGRGSFPGVRAALHGHRSTSLDLELVREVLEEFQRSLRQAELQPNARAFILCLMAAVGRFYVVVAEMARVALSAQS
jgi:hypothetical protein